MSYSVEYEPEALADLERLTQAVCARVINKITWLTENFDQITPQTLTADLSGFLNWELEITELSMNLAVTIKWFLLTESDIEEQFTTKLNLKKSFHKLLYLPALNTCSAVSFKAGKVRETMVWSPRSCWISYSPFTRVQIERVGCLGFPMCRIPPNPA